MKFFFLMAISFLICNISINAQVENDFRNLRWGMSLNEVKANEILLLTREAIDSTEFGYKLKYASGYILEYSNATVGGRDCNIRYRFTNGRLTGINIYFLRTGSTFSRNVRSVLPYFRDVIIAMENKGYDCWLPLLVARDEMDLFDGNDDVAVLRKIEDCYGKNENLQVIDSIVKARQYPLVFSSWENKRSGAFMIYYTPFHANEKNIAAILKLFPNENLKNQIQKSDF